jgi:hypothetical protein
MVEEDLQVFLTLNTRFKPTCTYFSGMKPALTLTTVLAMHTILQLSPTMGIWWGISVLLGGTLVSAQTHAQLRV